jgi:DNA-binding transcriptional MerR regulator
MGTLAIGRFSRLTGLSVKALRLYGELGLLPPASVDPQTGYRSYSVEQVERAESIRLLRRLELPLDEIAAILAADDPTRTRELLLGHQRRMATRAVEVRAVLQGLQPLLDGKESVMGNTVESVDHRRLGIDLFNKTWTLMEKEDRTREDDDEMVHCAHASAYHWQQVGSRANRARSEWQCSRVYTVLGRAEPAVEHARRCLELVESAPDEMEDWDAPAAYEALSRAYLVAGDRAEAKRWLARGEKALAQVDDADVEPIKGDLRDLRQQLLEP